MDMTSLTAPALARTVLVQIDQELKFIHRVAPWLRCPFSMDIASVRAPKPAD
jgi:hypothetical protein